MNEYIIITDSSCDLSKEMICSRGIRSIPLSFRFNGDDKVYSNDEMPISDFYDKMRAGEVAKTSAVNPNSFVYEFEKHLKRGKDLLYIGFSSGLSTTYNSARLAVEQLKNRYPDKKIITVDTLAASAGIALLLDTVIEQKNNGATIEEAAEYAENLKLKICHWFTVDDLVYLKRGGRISPTAALVGNMLGIKPILHVDNEGHLTNRQKVRGRHYAIETLASKLNETRDKSFPAVAYISHADCLEDARKLEKILIDKYGVKTELITNVGAVIGAHSGPGTLALFFIGKER